MLILNGDKIEFRLTMSILQLKFTNGLLLLHTLPKRQILQVHNVKYQRQLNGHSCKTFEFFESIVIKYFLHKATNPLRDWFYGLFMIILVGIDSKTLHFCCRSNNSG